MRHCTGAYAEAKTGKEEGTGPGQSRILGIRIVSALSSMLESPIVRLGYLQAEILLPFALQSTWGSTIYSLYQGRTWAKWVANLSYGPSLIPPLAGILPRQFREVRPYPGSHKCLGSRKKT